MATCHAPRGPRSRSSAAPLCFGYASGGGQTWRWVRGWRFALRVGFAESEGTPPAPSALPPKFGGLLGEDLSVEVRVGALVKLIANLEAPECKTPTLKKPRDRPTPGGSAEGTGGMSSHSARPTTSHPASQKPTNRRQVCPPPERSEVQGGRGRATARAAGGAGRAFGCAEPE